MAGESRKLQKVGGGTFTVSVPKEWATDNALSAGDTVHLYPDDDGSLMICGACDGDASASATVRTAPGREAVLPATVRAAYAAGIERLTISAADELTAEPRRDIDRVVRQRTGMHIVDERDDRVTVRTAIEDAHLSVERTVVQLQFVTHSLFRTATELALSPNPSVHDRIEDRSADADGLVALLTRQFTRSVSRPGTAATLDVDRARAFDYYRIARSLDRLRRHSVAIAALDVVGAADDDVVATMRSVAEGVRHYVEQATTAVLDDPPSEPPGDGGPTRGELRTTLSEVEAAVAANSDARELLWLFEDCVDCGDRIADVARQAALRRDGFD